MAEKSKLSQKRKRAEDIQAGIIAKPKRKKTKKEKEQAKFDKEVQEDADAQIKEMEEKRKETERQKALALVDEINADVEAKIQKKLEEAEGKVTVEQKRRMRKEEKRADKKRQREAVERVLGKKLKTGLEANDERPEQKKLSNKRKHQGIPGAL